MDESFLKLVISKAFENSALSETKGNSCEKVATYPFSVLNFLSLRS